MKVGVFAGNLTVSGSGSIRTIGLTKYLPTYGCSVTLFSRGRVPNELKYKVKHISYNKIGIPSYLSKLSITSPMPFLPLDWLISKFAVLPRLASENYDILHCHQHGLTSIALTLRKWINVPILFDVYGLLQSDVKNQLPVRTRIEYPLLMRWEKALFKRVDGISVPSVLFKNYMIKHLKIKEEKTFVIPNGVDLGLFQRKIDQETTSKIISCFGIDGKHVIMYIGGIDELHGLLDLVKAIDIIDQKQKNTLKGIVLIIIGKGHFIPFVREYIQRHRLDNVILFDEKVPHENLPIYLNIADVLIIPHPKIKQNEWVYSIKLLEYLASGNPIVATNLKAVSELIKDGKTGILVEAGNPESIADGIVHALDDDGLRKRIGKHGRKLMTKEYSWKSFTQKTIEAYETILSRWSK